MGKFRILWKKVGNSAKLNIMQKKRSFNLSKKKEEGDKRE